MSNSGFGSISSPVKSGAPASLSSSGQVLQIIKLPQQLQVISQAIRIEGQITQANQDGTVRIQTSQGEIQAQVRGNRQPQLGQQVEVELPPSNSRQPNQAAIRDAAEAARISQRLEGRGDVPRSDAPRAQPNQQQTQQQAQAAVQRATTSNTPVDPRQIPLQPIRSGQVTTAALPQTTNVTEGGATVPRPTAAPVQVGDIVRLLSVTPAKAQEIANNIINTGRPDLFKIQTPAPNQPISTIQNFTSVSNASALNAQPISALISTQNIGALSNPLNMNFVQQIQQGQPLLTQPAQAIVTRLDNIASIVTQNVTSENAVQLLKAVQPALTTPVSTSNISTSTPTQAISTEALAIRPTAKADVQIVQFQTPSVTIKPVGVQPALPAATAIPGPLAGAPVAGALPAVVTGFTAEGFPLVTTQLSGSRLPQSFIMQFPANNLTIGSRIHIIPQSITPQAGVVTPATVSAVVTNPLLNGFQWPALDALYQSLITSSPQLASSMAKILPNPANPTQLTAAGMVFIAAVKSGDMNMMLGDKKLEAIQRLGARNLLSQLTQSSAAPAATAEPASSGEWRAVPLPMFWEGEIQKVTLYTRREDGDASQENDQNDGQTRFVFDLSLSRMGDVQIDGLLKEKRLDLVVRTENAFSQPMQDTIRGAYVGALDQTELSGNVMFQGSKSNWVRVLEAKEQLGVSI